MSAAIDQYIYITVNQKFDSQIRVSYSTTEIVDRVQDLKHDLVREVLQVVGIEGGVEITSISGLLLTGTAGFFKQLHSCVELAQHRHRHACSYSGMTRARQSFPYGLQLTQL